MRKLIFILLFVSLKLSATNYYISNSGNNLNSGMSISEPWATFQNLSTLGGGDTVFLERGSIWNNGLTVSGSGTALNKIVVTAYGEGERPVLNGSGVVEGWNVAGNWRQTATNVWQISQPRLGSASCRRIWINGVEQEKTGRPQSINEYPPTSLKRWYQHPDSSWLYVYSTGNPATTYNSIEKGIAVTDLLRLENQNYYIIRDIEFRHGFVGVNIKNSREILIDNCVFSSWYGVRMEGDQGSENQWAQNVEIKNCVFNPERLQVYDGWETDYTQDAIFIRGGSRNVDVHHCYFRDYGHAAVTIESLTWKRIDNVKVFNNELTSPNVDYGNRLAAYYRFGEGNEMFRNYIHNGSIQNQFNARGFKFYYNVIDTIKDPAWLPGRAVGIYVGDAPHGQTYSDSMHFYNNVIANCSHGIFLAWYSRPPEQQHLRYNIIHGNKFINNIIYNPVDQAIRILDTDSIYNNTFQNNIIYKEGDANTVYYRGLGMNVAAWELSGANDDVIENNISQDPLFQGVKNFELQFGSPAINAGIDVGLDKDYRGWSLVGLPDIGAYEYGASPPSGIFLKDESDVMLRSVEGTLMKYD